MIEALVVVVCLVLNALFAAYEMAFVSIPRSALRSLAKEGNKDAKSLLTLREHPERTLSIIQIGITLVGAIAAAAGGAGAGDNLEPYLMQAFDLSAQAAEFISVALVVIPITYLSVVVGELVPKTLALRNPVKIVLAGARVLFFANRVFSPVITTLEGSTSVILKVFFRRTKSTPAPEDSAIAIDDFSPVHQSFMMNMADIEKKIVRDIMVPWSQVVSLNIAASVEDVLQVILSSGHTRLPVLGENRTIGLLHTKEFMGLKESGEQNWQSIIRPMIRVQPMDSAFGVMRTLQEKKNHMTIVVAASGELLGIVTLEDILEEIVGDIFDEDDDDRIRKVYAAKIKTKMISMENESIR